MLLNLCTEQHLCVSLFNSFLYMHLFSLNSSTTASRTQIAPPRFTVGTRTEGLLPARPTLQAAVGATGPC